MLKHKKINNVNLYHIFDLQHMLDHLRTQLCLSTVGRHIKAIIFAPDSNFYNLYEFMSMVSYYAETRNHALLSGLGSKVHTLRYTFPCSHATREEDARLYGTGGKLV